MKITNKITGRNVTSEYLALMQGIITKQEFELITYMKNLLVDGNIDVHIKFLDLQKYDDEKFKDSREYTEDVREKMKHELNIYYFETNFVYYQTLTSYLLH